MATMHTVWRSEDGLEFFSEEAALAHEKQVKQAEEIYNNIKEEFYLAQHETVMAVVELMVKQYKIEEK